MSRKFIAAVLAVSTAIAGFSAASARAATQDDIAKLLAGAATIFIIGKAIESSRDKDRNKKAEKKSEVRQFHHTPKAVPNRHIPKVVPRHRHKFDRYATLPRKCVRRIEGGHVKRVIMGRCLERNSYNARALPRACRMKVSTHRGTRRAFALPCLRNRGYTLARN